MNLKYILNSIAHTYEKLPSDLKLPFAFFLIIPLLFIRLFELLFLGIAKVFSFKSRHKTARSHKHIRTRKKIKKTQFIFIPLSTKVKYFFSGIFFSLIFICLPLVFLIFIQDLPNPHDLSVQEIPQTTRIYDRNKVLLYEIYSNQNRTIVTLNDIPKYLQEATLAIEDKNFYKHPGFDIASIIRAFKKDLTNGSALQGGSTITQQLIKSSLLTSEKTLSRKLKELVLAFWAEHVYSKNQILEMYFNEVPYGGSAWGVEAASEVYFGKHVKDLSLAESAFLAGLTQAPSTYSPFGPNPTLWKKRQQEVLNRMVAVGYISKTDADKAVKEKIVFKKQAAPIRAPHFSMFVKDWLIKEYGIAAVEKGGLNVITSLDIKKQEMAEKIVAEEVNNAAYLNLTNGAVLVTDPKNGDILAMVGSKDYNDPNGGNINMTNTPRQPGSTVKAITYSAALMKGFTAASIIDDAPTAFPTGKDAPLYTPVNYGGRYFGRITLRFALGNSLNIPAVKTLNAIGIPSMITLAQNMGISHWDKPADQYGLSATLGGYEATMIDMATVFGTLSNGGERVDLNPILSVTDAKGHVLEQKKTIEKERVLPQGIAYIISNILSDNPNRAPVFGANSLLAIPGHTVSVKTGTTDNLRDNWTIGYTNNYVVAAWVGNNDNNAEKRSLLKLRNVFL